MNIVCEQDVITPSELLAIYTSFLITTNTPTHSSQYTIRAPIPLYTMNINRIIKLITPQYPHKQILQI